MTLDQLLEQLKTLLDDGYFDANNQTDEDKLIDWLRTHISEMVKEAVGDDEFQSYSLAEGRNDMRHEILQTLGISK